MTWGKLCDTFHSHPKIAEAGNAAAGLFARLISWSNDHLTDGRIPQGIVRMYSEGDDQQIQALIDQRLLEQTAGGYQIHDFLDHNDDAETVRARNESIRAKRSAAGKKGAEARWQNGKRHGKRHGKKMAKSEAADPADSEGETPISPQPENNDLDGKNGKPIANAMANGWQTDGPDPVPVMIDKGSAGDPSDALEIHEIEQIGYPKYRQLAGAAQAEIRRRLPIYRHELEAAMKTKGRSWAYAVEVIDTIRAVDKLGPAEPGSPTPPRKESAFAEATRTALEMEVKPRARTTGNYLDRIRPPNDAPAGLLFDASDRSGPVESE